MDFDPDMVRDQAHDTFAVRGGQRHAGVADAFPEPIDPQAAIGVEHHFDDGGVFKPGRDRRSERRAQHPRAA